MKAWSFGGFFSSLAVPAGLQKHLVSFLLKRAIGQFLEDDLDLENLDIELSNGIVQLNDLRLNTRTLNEYLAGTPLAVKQGRIKSITTTIPWRNLWNGQCMLDINGIDITLVPVQASANSAHEHFDQHLSSSMDLANDFLRQQQQAAEKAGTTLQESLLQSFHGNTTPSPLGLPGDFNSRPMAPTSTPISAAEEDIRQDGEGTQFVARLIEALLARIWITVNGTTVRLHHQSSLPLVKPHPGAATQEKIDYELEIRLPSIKYRDETPGRDQPVMDASFLQTKKGTDSLSGSTTLEESILPSVIWQDSPESIKTISLDGFSIWIRQQGKEEELVTEVDFKAKESPAEDQDGSDSDEFVDAQDTFSHSMMASQIGSHNRNSHLAAPHGQARLLGRYEAQILSTLGHKARFNINIRKNATIKADMRSTTTQAQPTINSLMDIDFILRSVFIAISPNQIAFILEILDLMSSPPSPVSFDQRTPPRTGDDLGSEPVLPDLGTRIPGVDNRANVLDINDSYMERNLPTQHSSPRRTQPSDPMGTQPRSVGGRPLEHDRHSDMRSHRAYAPFPSSQGPSMLGGSIYAEHRSAAPMTSGESSGVSSSLTLKLKARFPEFHIFVLYKDPESRYTIPTEANFYKDRNPEALKSGHLKLAIDNMSFKYQKWSKENRSLLDFGITKLTLSEWIEPAPGSYDPAQWNRASDQSKTRIPPRRTYIPLIEFDTDQDSLLQTPATSKLPVLKIPDRYLSGRGILLRSEMKKRQGEQTKVTKAAKSSEADPSTAQKDKSIKSVIRVRVYVDDKSEGVRSSTSASDATEATSSSYAQEVTVDVNPMQVHLDFYTIQRLEKCLLAVMGRASSPASEHNSSQTSRSQPPIEQIMVDLDGPRKINKAKSLFRLRLMSIQLWVSIPDMALTLAREKDTGPEYRSIYDMLSVNISGLRFTHISDGGKRPAGDQKGSSLKVNVEFSSVSAFVIPERETTSKAFLMIGSLPTHAAAHSGFNSSLPNLEITVRSPESLPTRQQIDPSHLPSVLKAFAGHEEEDEANNAAEDEEELDFKHQTLETSLLVINTQLPLIAVHLEKRILDTLQLRLNDISTWLAIFSEQLEAKIPKAPMEASETGGQDGSMKERRESVDDATVRQNILDEAFQDSIDGGFGDDVSEHGTDRSTAYGEELRHKADGTPVASRGRDLRDYQYQPRTVKPTMTSLLIFVQTVELILDYPTTGTVLDPPIVKTYQINVGEARVFAAAKYQGGVGTYLSIDAEDLEAWEITAQRPKALLLTRTIHKSVKLKTPRPIIHMTSFLSFDPEAHFKENITSLVFAGISWKFSIDQTAVDDVQDFFTEPAGIIYYNPPGQRTRIRVSLLECGMDYKPLHIPSRFVLSFEKMKVFSTLIPELPTLKSKVQIYNMNLFLIDQVQSVMCPQHPGIGSSAPGIDSKSYWKSLGFALIGQCLFFELNSVKSKTEQLPRYDLMITNEVFYLETCSDSFQTFLELAGYMADNGDMPIEKKKILERLAEAERAANRAKSNVIYQDILAASLDENAFRNPRLDQPSEDASTLDFHEGFFSVGGEDSENDMLTAEMEDIPDLDGFHEVYAELLGSPEQESKLKRSTSRSSTRSTTRGPQSTTERRSISKTRSKTLPALISPEVDEEDQEWTFESPATLEPKRRSSVTVTKRDARTQSHARQESQMEDTIVQVDPEAKFDIIEDHFSIPVLTKEEMARDEGSNAILRLRVRDFNFCWRLYDGLDWEVSRLDEVERKRQARQLAKRLHDPEDNTHGSMDPQSHLDTGVFDRLSGLQHRKSTSSSDAGSISDYQAELMSQAGGVTRGRASSSSSGSGSRRSTHQRSQSSHTTGHHDLQQRRKKLERSAESMIEFSADRVRVDFEDYVPNIETASHLAVGVKQFEIIDNLKTSLWNKFLSHQRPDTHTATPRQTQSNMVRIDLDGVRPVPTASTVEHRLRVKILPLRLYVDQDALMFLIKFFVPNSPGGSPSPERAEPEDNRTSVNNAEKKKPNEMYFQSVHLGEISVKVDYKPKHVDYTGLTGGNLVELMNFFHLDAAEMTLQEVELHGINGFPKLAQELVDVWLPHILSTQVPHMVSGLTPIRSLVNVGSGIADLVLLPIEQYKRDGHIIRGLQKGGRAFTKATTLEALKIGTKLAVGTQVLLEHADDIFGSSNANAGPSTSTSRNSYAGTSEAAGGKKTLATMVSDSEGLMEESIDDEDQLLQYLQSQEQQQQYYGHGGSSEGSMSSGSTTRVSKYANQPIDINEGMEHAYKSLSKNIGTAAHTIFAVPMEVYERTGAQGSVRAVIRAVPVAVLKPMIGATEAFSKVLIGIRNSIDPEQRLQMEDKYKHQ